jgi:hypothetical protein
MKKTLFLALLPLLSSTSFVLAMDRDPESGTHHIPAKLGKDPADETTLTHIIFPRNMTPGWRAAISEAAPIPELPPAERAARGTAMATHVPVLFPVKSGDSSLCRDILVAAYKQPAEEIAACAEAFMKHVPTLFSGGMDPESHRFILKTGFSLGAEEISARAEALARYVPTLFPEGMNPKVRGSIVQTAFTLPAKEFNALAIAIAPYVNRITDSQLCEFIVRRAFTLPINELEERTTIAHTFSLGVSADRLYNDVIRTAITLPMEELRAHIAAIDTLPFAAGIAAEVRGLIFCLPAEEIHEFILETASLPAKEFSARAEALSQYVFTLFPSGMDPELHGFILKTGLSLGAKEIGARAVALSQYVSTFFPEGMAPKLHGSILKTGFTRPVEEISAWAEALVFCVNQIENPKYRKLDESVVIRALTLPIEELNERTAIAKSFFLKSNGQTCKDVIFTAITLPMEELRACKAAIDTVQLPFGTKVPPKARSAMFRLPIAEIRARLTAFNGGAFDLFGTNADSYHREWAEKLLQRPAAEIIQVADARRRADALLSARGMPPEQRQLLMKGLFNQSAEQIVNIVIAAGASTMGNTNVSESRPAAALTPLD